MYRAENLSKSFGKKQVLRDLSFTIIPGEVLAVLGPSGCGKTVLIQILTGLLPFDEGEVFFDNKPLKTLIGKEHKSYLLELGFMFQQGALFDFLSVEENLALPLVEHTQLGKKEVRTRIAKILRQLDLGDIQNKMPFELSGGMLKRVSLARSLMLKPRMLFCDEPCSGLDPLRKKMVYDLIKKVRDDSKATVVVVTHDAELVPDFADRALILNDGGIAAIETMTKPSRAFESFAKGVWAYAKGEETWNDFR